MTVPPKLPDPVAEDLEDLFENAPCGYLLMQPDGRIIKVNRTFETWTGHDAGSLVGRRFQDLLNIAGKVYYETHFAPLLRMQGFFNEVALDLVREDESRFPVLVNAVERRDEAGNLRFIRVTIFNASDRRRYERELLEARRGAEQANADLRALNATLEARVAEAVAERLKVEDTLRQAQKMEAVGQLTGGIAHDFNNMMAVILAALTLIERKLAKGETDVADLTAAARDGADRAVALTQGLLAFSRQQALSPQVLNANRMVADLSELLRRTLGETIVMETVLAGGLWKVRTDANQLENAIINLAVNARDAMPEGGRLTIETANTHLDDRYAAENAVAAGQYVMIAVTDTGTGMPPEIVAKIFEPFFTTKPPGKGTGLGLSQVFGFVKQSGGHIKVYSESGHGTSVKIYLRRHFGDADVQDETVETEPLPAAQAGVILVVEDDEHVRHLSEQMLVELNYQVVTACNGTEALRLLDRRTDICLVFTDVVMPDMNGRQLVEEARRKRPDIKVLYTTGYTRNAIVHNGVLDPDVDLLPKPATLEQMASKVRSVLDRPSSPSRS